MRPFHSLSAIAAPLPRDNVDTDAIFPGRFIQRMDIDFGRSLFAAWRFDADEAEQPDFVLNRPPFRQAEILVAGWNFGCGSSREHAVWALAAWGIRCVIAKSFGDIFFGNCVNNGLLAVALPEPAVEDLMRWLATAAEPRLQVDLPAQTVGGPAGPICFDITPERKHRLLQGLDEIDLTLERAGDIARFSATHGRNRPWVFEGLSGSKD